MLDARKDSQRKQRRNLSIQLSRDWVMDCLCRRPAGEALRCNGGLILIIPQEALMSAGDTIKAAYARPI